MVVVYFAMFGNVTGALFGIPIAYLLRLVRMPWRRGLYFAAVAATVVPYALHYRYSLKYLARSGVEGYSGLDQYMVAVPVTAGVTVVVALVVAWLRPILAAPTPVVFGVAYWLLLVPLLYRGTPATFVPLDNVPFIWLFGFSVAGCVFLLLVSILALGRPGSVVRQDEQRCQHED
ncbi:MAG: hypothetical protein RQ899_08305 [Pseudomonadales bacterium]|nr:hypothetical protein [Pseudomonadales bacterium]